MILLASYSGKTNVEQWEKQGEEEVVGAQQGSAVTDCTALPRSGMDTFHHSASQRHFVERAAWSLCCTLSYAVNYRVWQQGQFVQLFHKLLCPPAPVPGSFSGGRAPEQPQAGDPLLQHHLCRDPCSSPRISLWGLDAAQGMVLTPTCSVARALRSRNGSSSSSVPKSIYCLYVCIDNHSISSLEIYNSIKRMRKHQRKRWLNDEVPEP